MFNVYCRLWVWVVDRAVWNMNSAETLRSNQTFHLVSVAILHDKMLYRFISVWFAATSTLYCFSPVTFPAAQILYRFVLSKFRKISIKKRFEMRSPPGCDCGIPDENAVYIVSPQHSATRMSHIAVSVLFSAAEFPFGCIFGRLFTYGIVSVPKKSVLNSPKQWKWLLENQAA